MKDPDVLVIGGGQAGITAAICAAEAGARVRLVEAAPVDFRGGNSRHTRNLRAMHEAPVSVLEGEYPEAEYFDDLMRVTAGNTNDRLARLTIAHSAETVPWLIERGVKFQPPLSGTLHLARTNAFFLGGGKALLNALYRHAEGLDIEIDYDTRVVDLDIDNGQFRHAVLEAAGATERVAAATLIAAAGGFESNIEWLREAWGDAADNFLIRGTPWNRGEVLKTLLDAGVMQTGDPQQCHAVAIDARAPGFDGGIVTRVDCVPLGIVVNRNAERFHDEGEDFWPKRYATWGRLIASQPEQVAWVVIDNKCDGRFIPPVFPPETAETLPELGAALGLDPARFRRTVEDFNGAVQPGHFDHNTLDDCHTAGLSPPKSHWAQTLDTPPYAAWPLAPGITFTYLATVVGEDARVFMSDGEPAANIFATGEIMAGNILGEGYLAGIGMTIGNVFGRIAGKEAARYAR